MNLSKEQVLGYSVINNRLKIFVKKGFVSSTQQPTKPNNESKEIIYYTLIPDENNILKNPQSSKPQEKIYTVKITTSDNKIGKVSINLTKKALSFPNRYIEPFCDVTNSGQFKNKSPDGIKLVKEGEAKFENGNWVLTKKVIIEYQ